MIVDQRTYTLKPGAVAKYFEAKVHCGSCGTEWTGPAGTRSEVGQECRGRLQVPLDAVDKAIDGRVTVLGRAQGLLAEQSVQPTHVPAQRCRRIDVGGRAHSASDFFQYRSFARA